MVRSDQPSRLSRYPFRLDVEERSISLGFNTLWTVFSPITIDYRRYTVHVMIVMETLVNTPSAVEKMVFVYIFKLARD